MNIIYEYEYPVHEYPVHEHPVHEHPYVYPPPYYKINGKKILPKLG